MLSLVQLFATWWTVACKVPLSWHFPGKNTGVGCHFLLQGIFPNRGSNPPLLWFLHRQMDFLFVFHNWATCKGHYHPGAGKIVQECGVIRAQKHKPQEDFGPGQGPPIQKLGIVKEAISQERHLTQDRAREETTYSSPPLALQFSARISHWPNLSRDIIPWDTEQSKEKQVHGRHMGQLEEEKIPPTLSPSNHATPQQAFSCLSDFVCLTAWFRTQRKDGIPIWNQYDGFCVGDNRSPPRMRQLLFFY